VLREYLISTGKKGLGELRNSEQTPRGWHKIRAKIGDGLPTNAVIVGRRFSNEIYTDELAVQFPTRDWILTRILWLSGLEKGFNRLGVQDTMARYIYIHGCPDHFQLGMPLSHGCIRMRNHDILELFDLVPVGTRVLISER
jgi:lipoprotein-anchoring transpeptidase ErfK/SrfK